MAEMLQQVIDDLAAEHAALAGVLHAMSRAQWDLPTHAPGWAVRDQVTHLAEFDEAAALAFTDPDGFRTAARAMGPDFEARYLAKGRAMDPGQLLAWWGRASSALVAAARETHGASRLPWYGPDMSSVSFITARLMECWSHGLDVVDVVGIPRPDTGRLRHVAFIGVRARPYSYANRRLDVPAIPVRVSLTSPSGETWELGEPSEDNVVCGTATDFCRVVTRRRHLLDTALEVTGPAAREWLEIAQAFAGPPGEGRQPGQFPLEPAP
jgi:uncharacterized protein (TIGR03084 family)